MSEHLLFAVDPDGDDGEPIAVETHDDVVELRRTDGTVLRFDRTELAKAIEPEQRAA